MTNEEQTKKILEKSIRQGFIQGKCSEIISEINALRQRYYEMCLNCTKHTSSDYCEACRRFVDNCALNDCMENRYFEYRDDAI